MRIKNNYTNTNMPNKDSAKLLQSLLEDGKMELSEVLDMCDMVNKKKIIREKYQNKIKHRKDDDRYYIYINRKQVIAKSEDALYQKLYDLEYGTQTYSMSDIFPLWLKWKRDNTAVTGRTLRIYTEQWDKYFADHSIINKPIKDVTAKDFTELFRKWTSKRQLSTKMFNNLKSLCNGIYSYAISELEIVSFNPIKGMDMRQFPMKPVANNDDNVFTDADRKLLLNHLKDDSDPYALAISFDFNVTMRFAELSALRQEDYKDGVMKIRSQHLLDVDMNDDLTFSENRFINSDHVKGNTEHGFRSIPLNDTARACVEKAISLNPGGEFIFMFDDKQLSVSTFNARLRRYCKEIGIPYRSSHKIRFCVASILYQNGMPLTELKRLLGHSTTAMTLHYLRNVSADSHTLDIMQSALG